jgi:hypothetical protein
LDRGRRRQPELAGEAAPLEVFASAIGSDVNCRYLSWVRIMKKMLSENFMQAAVSSVNFGSLVAPSASRKRREAARSLTGRFTKIIWLMVVSPS